MKTRNILGLIALASLSFTSCSEDEVLDQAAPTITITSPENHEHFDMGMSFVVDATFEDDLELASFHVHLGDQEGNHTHDLEYEVSGNLTGTSYHLVDTVQIPDSLGMMYWLHFDVTDAESKTSSEMVMLHFDMDGMSHGM
jgi:hypothetical protein